MYRDLKKLFATATVATRSDRPHRALALRASREVRPEVRQEVPQVVSITVYVPIYVSTYWHV